MRALLLVIITSTLYGQPVVTGPRVDLTHSLATAPMKLVTTLPTGSTPYIPCKPGDTVLLTTAPLGQQIYVNSGTGSCVWTQQGGGGGSMIYPPAGIPVSTGSAWGSAASAGNIIGLWAGCSGSNILLASDGTCHNSTGGGGGSSYITAATSSPQTIAAATHGEGINPIVYCFSGPVVSTTTTGHEVYCDTQKDSSGNVIITWSGATVASLQVFSSGAGPAGPAGPTGPAGSGLADPGSNGPIKRTALNVTAPALFSDIVGLFSACSGTQYLGADGACHTPTTTGLADPGSNGIIKRTALNTTAPAVFGDIFALFSGCSGIQYPGFDGNCHTPAGGGGVSSVALTAMSWINVGGLR